MAEVAAPPQAFAERLLEALKQGLAKVGISAEIEVEPVPTTLLHRVLVVSPQWGNLSFSDRQEVVWRVLDHAFPRDEHLYVSSIWTMTPDEMEGK